ncbi:MAG: carboxypeptidase regulatory-like domain-containing protein [Thermoguttaceae bacterium]|nr:carboxypeptidase regulatory-like domain-containing protein [Thermoguttaceae bacterium]
MSFSHSGRGVFTGVVCSFVLLGAAFGCKEKRPDGMPDLVPVKLTITQEGKPLAEAEIGFYNSENARWGVGGIADENGVTKIRTYGKYEGAPAGKYKVTVSKIRDDGKAEMEGLSPLDPKYGELRQKYPLFYLVPAKYRDEAETPLEIEIGTKKVEQTIDIPESCEEPVPTGA